MRTLSLFFFKYQFVNIWFDRQVVAIPEEYFQDARLKVLFLFYFFCASFMGKKSFMVKIILIIKFLFNYQRILVMQREHA